MAARAPLAANHAVLNNQLTTRKVPIPRFPSRKITPEDWITIKPHLEAALVNQGCQASWSLALAPDVEDDTSAVAVANTVNAPARAQIARYEKCVALLTSSFVCGQHTINHHDHHTYHDRRMAKRTTMAHL